MFEGTVYCKTLGQQLSAEISVSNQGVVARQTDGTEHVIPHSQCMIEIGGMSGRMVMCHNHDRTISICSEDADFAGVLQAASGGIHSDQMRNAKRSQSKSRWRHRRFALILLSIFLSIAIGGYFAIIAGARAAVLAAPTTIDIEIGKMLGAGMDHGGDEVTDPKVVDAVEQIVNRLRPVAKSQDFKFEVLVIDAPIVNAYAVPGGLIVVYTELIRQSESPEQVAGVIAHEMAHVTLRHGMQGVAQSVGLVAAVNLVFGDVGGLTGMGVDTLEQATLNSYSRRHESEADAEGVRMLSAADIDPSGLAAFFDHLKEQESGQPHIPAWISTHPDHDDRIKAIQSRIESHDQESYEPIDVDWDAVKARL